MAAASGTVYCTGSAAGRIGSPSISRMTPSSTRTNALAPASTTPASRSTSSSSGVRRSESSARRMTCTIISCRLWLCPAANSAASAASRDTVRMVPSTGSSSDSYSWFAPVRMARATSLAEATSRSPSDSRNPRRKWESSMPELPRAPKTQASAMARVTAGNVALLWSARTASAAARSVIAKLVPVSPSGTGKTLMRLSSSRPASTQSAAARTDRLRRGPSR
jgi:hypothetical protein